jgi:hypothetical protein
MTRSNTVLPDINSDEAYEKLNFNDELFLNAAREILARHNLPVEQLSLLGGSNIVFSYGDQRIDQAIFRDPEISKDIIDSTIEAFRNGVSGPAYEMKLLFNPWGFDLENI